MIVVGTPEECEVARRLFASAVHRLGTDAPDVLRTVEFAAIRGHSGTLPATSLDVGASVVDRELMSYSQAAQFLGCSTRTITRRVRAGDLARVGRQVTAASVNALASRGDA
ncbi:MAG: hypothetical protein CL424_07755 [Acidimicrobiaceae bacterium]|nr:hypothetical protein [Acidimicrobiaceae bacterium]